MMDLSEQIKRASLHVAAAELVLQAKMIEHQAAMMVADKPAIEMAKADIIFAQDVLLNKKQIQSRLSLRSLDLDPDEAI